MLIILTVGLVIASVWIFCVKRTRESMYLLGLCLSLMLEICGVMIFIAKKGGISTEVMYFFFFSNGIKAKIQYMLITLNQLGYIVALGRTLYPLFLVELAMSYSMINVIRKNTWISKLAVILPAITLVLYFPKIYRELTLANYAVSGILGSFSIAWMTLYLLFAAFLLIHEYGQITMRFCRRQFSQIMVCLMALSGIYVLHYWQDPGQVYHFSNYSFVWQNKSGYMQIDPSLFSYSMLVAISVICSVLGFYSLFRYTQGYFKDDKENVVMERKFDTAKVGASVFVHSMKNQLLSSKVLYKRIGQLYEQPNPDMEKLKEYIDTLENLNNTMLTRMEELYRCVKSNSIYLVPTELEEIVTDTLERFSKKFPEVTVRVEIEKNVKVLSDKTHLCEALYNLLVNAEEAIIEADKKEAGQVAFICHNERLYTVIEVRDNGNGMNKSQIKQIFEPFYSSKNSNSNWGMGLYYVREIVKSHLGSLRVESKIGKGSHFFILLPKYEE